MRALTFLVAVLVAGELYAATLEGRVVGVQTATPLLCLTPAASNTKFGLSAIDAPEFKQAFGSRSKQNLSRLVFGHDVRVEWQKRDRYRRILGKVWTISPDAPCQASGCPKTLDANLAQITAGRALHYKHYEATNRPKTASVMLSQKRSQGKESRIMG